MAAIDNHFAKALVEVTFELNQYERVDRDLNQFNQLLQNNQELNAFYKNPVILVSQKKSSTSQILSKLGFSKISSNFLFILVDRNRIDRLNVILEAFRQGVRERLGVLWVNVTTSIDIDGDTQNHLMAALSKFSGKEVQLQFNTDPQILGGVIARVGDTIYGGSVRQQLQLITAQLSS